MLRPTASTWTQSLDAPSQLFGDRGGNDYELYEEDDEFVLTIDMPGFETDEIELSWDDGVLNVAAEHVDDERGRKKTYHRRFRFPKTIDEDAISAAYTNGVLEVELPVADAITRGRAVTVMSAIVAYAFSGDVSHAIILAGVLMGTAFLFIEGRRFQTYDIWRSRVRVLQENLFANALDPSAGVERRA